MILIVGGAGFVGRHLAELFTRQGQSIKVLDLRPLVGFDTIIGDVFSNRPLHQAMSDADVVIHLVGQGNIRLCQEDPHESYRLNVESVHNILEACRQHGTKLIFASTAAVYGSPEELPVNEGSPMRPATIYGWHKLAAEMLIRAYNQSYRVNFVILRLFNIYGEGSHCVINLFLQQAKDKGKITGYGLSQYRDFVYTGDVARAFYLAATSDRAVNKVVNIGTGHGTQIREVAEMARRFYIDIRRTDIVEETNPTQPYDLVADISRARALLNWEPEHGEQFMLRVIREEMLP